MKKAFYGMILATVAVVTPLHAQEASQKKMVLKTATAYGTNLPGLGTALPRLAQELDRMSGGNLNMKVYEPGKLVPPLEILDAVSAGNISAGYAAAGYWAGKIPAAPLFSTVPFGPETGEYIAWLYYGNGLKLYQDMYDQAGYSVKVLPCAVTAPETSGWFAREITSPDDLKGLKMRFFGLGAKVMEKLGVATSLLPGGEIFPALERGVIDATEYSTPAIDERLGFYKLIKYNYFPGWHQQSTIYELLINTAVWDKASEQHRAILENGCQAAMTDSFAHGEAIQFRAMRENTTKRGVYNKRWSEEMLGAYRAAWEEVVAEEAAKDAFFAKVWADLSAFRDKYKIWKENAFVPR